MIQLREASEADFEAICALITSEEELFFVYPRGRYPLSTGQLQHLRETRSDLTVLLENGRVQGFANLYDHAPDSWVFIGNVVLAKACRGRGLGRRLIRHMCGLAADKHRLPEVRISVFSHNIPALLLYAGAGFKLYDIEERKDYVGNRVALLHMNIKLSPPYEN